MKFAHIADCHIGSWRDPKLKDISTKAFLKAIDTALQQQVDFIIVAGDLFNTSFPRLDNLKIVVTKLKEVKDKQVPVYIIPGSHDYSPSGRTMLDVLEEAGLFINVFKGEVIDNKLNLKFTVDPKTGAKITGMLGKIGALERKYYENLEREPLEKEEGYKIFVFHSGLEEFKPKGMEKVDLHPLSLLPKNFNYYAGGHVHMVFQKEEPGYGLITYPGPLFPNSFAELEKLHQGGFYIVEDNKATWHPIQIHNVFCCMINADHKTPEQVLDELQQEFAGKEFFDTIVLIRILGTLESGKPSDIDLKPVFAQLYDKSAYFVMKNTAQLSSKEFKEIKIDAGSVDKIESELITEHVGQTPLPNVSEDEKKLITQLMEGLATERNEGETRADFAKRVKGDVSQLLKKEF